MADADFSLSDAAQADAEDGVVSLGVAKGLAVVSLACKLRVDSIKTHYLT